MHDYVDEIDILLAPFGAQKLIPSDLDKYNGATAGWRFCHHLQRCDLEVEIALLLDDEYPLSNPSIYLIEPKLNPLDIPHLEKEGKLCIWSHRVIADPSNIDSILILLSDTFDMLEEGLSGIRDNDFKDEFLSYFFLNHKDCTSTNVKSFCTPCDRNTREVYVYKSKAIGNIFADEKDELITILQNKGLISGLENSKSNKKKQASIQSSLLICFKEAWLPPEYPIKGCDLFRLVKSEFEIHADEVIAMIGKALLNQFNSTPCILVSFNTPNGVCFSGIEFSKGGYHREKYSNKSLLNGFRESLPINTLKQRVSGTLLRRATVDRNDRSWMMGRDNNHTWKRLEDHVVAIIGCGSVGAAIAKLLVKSGVQELLLFDNETLESENCSRHILGLDYEGRSKSEALSIYLKKQFPYIKIQFFSNDWRKAIVDDKCWTSFERSDVILSCTADWYSDQKLLYMQSQRELGVVVFAFVEAHAMAAHVIVNTVDSDAFNSLHYTKGNNVGKMKVPVTAWEDETVARIPACAGEFQPYGVIPLTHLHAMASETVMALLLATTEEEIKPLQKVWFSSTQNLESSGGVWSKEWVRSYGSPGKGKFELTIVFEDGAWKIDED